MKDGTGVDRKELLVEGKGPEETLGRGRGRIGIGGERWPLGSLRIVEVCRGSHQRLKTSVTRGGRPQLATRGERVVLTRGVKFKIILKVGPSKIALRRVRA